VLTSGPKPPNPSEILSAPALLELVDRFAQETQVILVDTPPTLIGPDAQIIAQQVGRAILIGRENATHLSDIRGAYRAMETASVKVLGSFYNHVDPTATETVGLISRILGRRRESARKAS
jgi:Mrp family chromosome partitioning ATPase